MESNILVLIGPPGSGKSTIANELVKSSLVVKVSRDDIRHSLKQVWYTTQDLEDIVTVIQDSTINALLNKGVDIVVDNTHCRIAGVKDFIKKWGKRANITLKPVGSELSMQDLKDRNDVRPEKPVPIGVIENMHAGFRHLLKNMNDLKELIATTKADTSDVKVVKQETHLPRCIVFDIDGTVAHMNGKRGPFDWKKVGLDEPDHNVLAIARALSHTYKIFFVSGRDESCRTQTQEWLNTHYLPMDYHNREWVLYMRPQNDFRKDSIVKEEIYYKHFAGKYYIEMFFDDRNQVVEQYRNMGFKVAQVAEGNF